MYVHVCKVLTSKLRKPLYTVSHAQNEILGNADTKPSGIILVLKCHCILQYCRALVLVFYLSALLTLLSYYTSVSQH